MFNCTTNKYDALYARWLDNPGKLLDLAGWKPGMTLLDLCGGTGAVTREALRRGASHEDIVLFDLNPRADDTGVLQVQGHAERAHWKISDRRFDVIVCRQSMGYLNVGFDLVEALHRLVHSDGKIVFNTFERPKWALKSYLHGDKRFWEASGYLFHWVWHIQAAWEGVDMTLFRWHTPKHIRREFGAWFTPRCLKTGKSIYWVCSRDSSLF